MRPCIIINPSKPSTSYKVDLHITEVWDSVVYLNVSLRLSGLINWIIKNNNLNYLFTLYDILCSYLI